MPTKRLPRRQFIKSILSSSFAATGGAAAATQLPSKATAVRLRFSHLIQSPSTGHWMNFIDQFVDRKELESLDSEFKGRQEIVHIDFHEKQELVHWDYYFSSLWGYFLWRAKGMKHFFPDKVPQDIGLKANLQVRVAGTWKTLHKRFHFS